MPHRVGSGAASLRCGYHLDILTLETVGTGPEWLRQKRDFGNDISLSLLLSLPAPDSKPCLGTSYVAK